MKKILFSVLLLISGITTYSQPSITPPIDATDCSNVFFKALLEEDGDALTNLLTTDFSVTSFNGQIIDRNLLINYITKGYLKVESAMLSGINTRDYGNVNVITGNWDVRGKLQNSDFQNNLAYMVICVKSGGNWKVSAVQLTPVR